MTMCAWLQAYLDQRDLNIPVEVETRTIEEVREAIGLLQQAGRPARINRIMLDNMARPDASAPGDVPRASVCHPDVLLSFMPPCAIGHQPLLQEAFGHHVGLSKLALIAVRP